MLRLQTLAKFSLRRGARSIWSSWLLARTSRTMFTTSRRSSLEPNQHQAKGEKLGGTEPPQVDPLPESSRLPPTYAVILALGVGLTAYGV